ncbi:MAG: DUF1273 family protein [Desulfobacteraceae bacterium]|nr:DUF1273 family protein [Desulfobacteraceae bacterium]
MNTACFTGHRKVASTFEGPYHDKLTERLVTLLAELYGQGYRNFISGGALGADQDAATAVIRLKQLGYLPGISLTIAQPFPSQASRWKGKSLLRYNNLLSQADKVIAVSPDPFTISKLFIRNEWMVQHSHLIIAIWDGRKSGGTYACMNYAKSLNRRVITINPISLNISW